MPKATQKLMVDVEEAEEDVPLHGMINEDEARAYRESLDKIFEDMAANIDNSIANVMELAIIDLRAEIVKKITGTEEVDTRTFLKSIQDPTCLALREQTEEVIAKLEEILPESETASGGDVIKSIDDVEALTQEQQHDITEIFDNLEIAHEYLGQSCRLMGSLLRSLSSKQLLLLLKASIRPLIQINSLAGFLDEPKAGVTGRSLLETKDDRVLATMTPAPSSKTLKNEKVNSPTRLVVATLAFKILNKFSSGITQRKMQDRYDVKPKQLALYLTGRRYLGGSDRKRRLSGQDKGASTSKKTKTQ